MGKRKCVARIVPLLMVPLFLASCGSLKDSDSFVTVSYYNNAETPSLVGIDYVVRGRKTSYRPVSSGGTTTTYDYVDRSGTVPALGCYRDFKEWDYGNYPEGSSYVSSSSEVPVAGEAVDPNKVLADCSATPVFQDAPYLFDIYFKDGGSYLRRNVAAEGEAEDRVRIGMESISVSTLQGLVESKDNLDYPGKVTGDDLPVPKDREGYVSEFLGYGSSADTRTKQGYVNPAQIGHAFSSGSGAPNYTESHDSGEFYVDSSSLDESGDLSYPLYIYLDNADDTQDEWVLLGNVADEPSFELSAVYSDSERITYDLSVYFVNETFPTDTTSTLLTTFVDAFAWSDGVTFEAEEASSGYTGTFGLDSFDGPEYDAKIGDVSFNPTGTLNEGYYWAFDAVDANGNEIDLSYLRESTTVYIRPRQQIHTMTVSVMNDYLATPTDPTVYYLDYGETFHGYDPTLEGYTFMGYSLLGASGYTLLDSSALQSVKENYDLYPVFIPTEYSEEVSLTASDGSTVAGTYIYNVSAVGGFRYSLTELSIATTPSASFDVTGIASEVASNRTGISVPVTELGTPFHTWQYYLRNVTLPSSVTTIRTTSFAATSLVSITMPGVTSIVQNAFYHCSDLTTVVLSAGVPISVGAFAFGNCPALVAINLNTASSLSIDFKAFAECTHLDLVLPDPSTITYIGLYAFADTYMDTVDQIKFTDHVPTTAETASWEVGWNYRHDDTAITPVVSA